MRGLASVSLEPFGRVYGIVVAIELAIRFLRSRAQVEAAPAPARLSCSYVCSNTSSASRRRNIGSSLNCLKAQCHPS